MGGSALASVSLEGVWGLHTLLRLRQHSPATEFSMVRDNSPPQTAAANAACCICALSSVPALVTNKCRLLQAWWQWSLYLRPTRASTLHSLRATRCAKSHLVASSHCREVHSSMDQRLVCWVVHRRTDALVQPLRLSRQPPPID